MMTDETDLSIRDLRQRFADRSLSPLEYWLALEKHIDAWEPVIAALYAYDPEAARQMAAASTERWARGAPLGPLDGVPVSIKDILLTKGWPTRRGSRTVDPAGPWLDDHAAS